MKEIYKIYLLGDMAAVYLYDTETEICGLLMLPKGYEERINFEGWWNIEPVVQIKVIGDPYPDGFIHGHSMRNNGTTASLKLKDQVVQTGEKTVIATILEQEGMEVRHILTYGAGDLYVTMRSEVISHRKEKLGVEMISSYNLCGFSCLDAELRMEDFVLHRMQSKWSMEGKLESTPFLDLQLEPAWLRIGANSVRFGQVGSMPVRKYFPWMVAEDKKYGYCVGMQLKHPASWQMEVYNKDEKVAFSGGLADREMGHWLKYLQAEECFVTPEAVITVAKEDVDGIGYRLTSAQWENLEKVPESERELPVIFNEYCTTWGNPTEENMLKIIDTLKGKGITYCVIDAGWHVKDGNDWSDIGDWITNRNRFPGGLSYVAKKVREAGMIPGLWYEMEVVGKDSEMFQKEEYLLKRDGYPIQTCLRRFLDMRQSAVWEFLQERVIDNLKDNGFGYLKVDYNDNIGIGCEGAESLGEGLRQNMEKSQQFFRKIREELPEIVIENCSSGGHRLEPSMQALCSMASFSDAHEWQAIPVIAANVTRAILPAQSQIWAVLRAKDDEKRLYYSLSNTFLGRMCLSGDIYDLSDWQWEIVDGAISFYKECAQVIRMGRNYICGPKVDSYNHLKGWQAVFRITPDEKHILAVVHTFAEADTDLEIALPKGLSSDYVIEKSFCRDEIAVSLQKDTLCLKHLESCDGLVLMLKK